VYEPSDEVGGWTLRERIGRGGMGEVWRAERDGAQAAVKVLYARPDRIEATAKRFEREVSAAAQIGHPGIAEVFAWGRDEDAGAMYLVMELLDGRSLREVWDATDDRRARVAHVRALLEPLAAAHALSPPIVHRDLKPENVFVTTDGAVKLLDFGIARRSGAGTDVTDTGAGIGTAAYMSPEQATDARDVGPAADVWSVGVMLYEALAGRPPFAAPSRNEIITKILTRAPVPLRDAAPGCPPELAALVQRCLAKEPERRPPDARSLAEALDAGPGPRPTAAPAWRTWWWVPTAGAVGLVLGLGSALVQPAAVQAPAHPAIDAGLDGGADAGTDDGFVAIAAPPATRLGVDAAALDEGLTGFRPAADGDVTPEGVRGLATNAREWTRDAYRRDRDGAQPEWVTEGERTYRAVRGLPVLSRSRFAPPPDAPIAHRVPLCATGDCPVGTADILAEVGFRCVR